MEYVMETFAIVALPLAAMGFIFGSAAFAQVTELKKEVQQLKDQLESNTGREE